MNARAFLCIIMYVFLSTVSAEMTPQSLDNFENDKEALGGYPTVVFSVSVEEFALGAPPLEKCETSILAKYPNDLIIHVYFYRFVGGLVATETFNFKPTSLYFGPRFDATVPGSKTFNDYITDKNYVKLIEYLNSTYFFKVKLPTNSGYHRINVEGMMFSTKYSIMLGLAQWMSQEADEVRIYNICSKLKAKKYTKLPYMITYGKEKETFAAE